MPSFPPGRNGPIHQSQLIGDNDDNDEIFDGIDGGAPLSQEQKMSDQVKIMMVSDARISIFLTMYILTHPIERLGVTHSRPDHEV